MRMVELAKESVKIVHNETYCFCCCFSLALWPLSALCQNCNHFFVLLGDHSIWIGGLVEPDKWDLSIGADNYPPIQKIFEKAQAFYPPLRNFTKSDIQKIVVGLRPGRHMDLNTAQDKDIPALVHNYGHAGAGYVMSWGAAIEVADLVEKAAVSISSKL